MGSRREDVLLGIAALDGAHDLHLHVLLLYVPLHGSVQALGAGLDPLPTLLELALK